MVNASLQNGDMLTAAVTKPVIVPTWSSTRPAFAHMKCDGSVVACGVDDCGGDSLAAQEQLRGVQQIYSTGWAFAAVKADGSVAAARGSRSRPEALQQPS